MRLTTRLKKSKSLVRLVRPLEVSANDLIYPIFVREDAKTSAIPSMDGQNYLSLNNAINICNKAVDVNIPAVLIFGVLKERDDDASIALDKNGFHSQIFRQLKETFGEELVLISNVCLCDYTKGEYCVYSKNGKVLNEKTAKMLGRIAVVHAEAGADVVAPAAMCDGQIKHIRNALDDSGFEDVAIMSYIKTNSSLFKPFKEAMTLCDVPKSIDGAKFRTDIINYKMFMQKVNLDISEGADIVIVKPALTNLDLILRVKQEYPNVPVAAYQVSGEYAMIKSLSENAHMNEKDLLMEALESIKRAGADMILTYHALQATQKRNTLG